LELLTDLKTLVLELSLKNVVLVVLLLTAFFFVLYWAVSASFAGGTLIATLVAGLLLAVGFWYIYRSLRPTKKG
jgi:hypothetical protein